MADIDKTIEGLKEALPPATDPITYLTLIESGLSPEILPALNEILQDAELTQAIGWDLVHNLIDLPGAEACLETVSRLGNPREVILKVLEALDIMAQEDDPEGDLDGGYNTKDNGEGTEEKENGQNEEPGNESKKKEPTVSRSQKFIILLGMLAILHKRIRTKYPSRFLAQTLQAVYNTYRPTQETTASIINLVHSLSGRRRPPLPMRRSSVNVANPDQDGDASKNAPDPEADGGEGGAQDPSQTQMIEKLLLCFVLSVLETYINRNDVAWAARLVEFYEPEKVAPGRKRLMASFKEDQELLERDAIVGQLVALTRDLGLTTCSDELLNAICHGPIKVNTLSDAEDMLDADGLELPTGGCICLVAYWVFSAELFEADQPKADMYMFPHHSAILEKYLQEDPQAQILRTPGTMSAIIALGLWAHFTGRLAVDPGTLLSKPTDTDGETSSQYMAHLRSLGVVSVFHPSLLARNAAIVLATRVLQADPSDEDRLLILKDIFYHCTFTQLRGCAVTWLREEIIRANPPGFKPTEEQIKSCSLSPFATDDALSRVELSVFTRTVQLADWSADEVLTKYLLPGLPFLHAVVNFAIFLFKDKERFLHILPSNMAALVRDRWYAQLRRGVDRVVSRYHDQSGYHPYQAPSEGPVPSERALMHEAVEPPAELSPEIEMLQFSLQELEDTEVFRELEARERRI